MKGWSTLAGNVTIRQLRRIILPNTKEQFMKGWSTLAGNVTIRQLQRGVLPNTKEQFMKGWGTIVLCAATKHPGGPLLTITGRKLILNSNFLFSKRIKLLRNVSKCLVLISAWQSFYWPQQIFYFSYSAHPPPSHKKCTAGLGLFCQGAMVQS